MSGAQPPPPSHMSSVRAYRLRQFTFLHEGYAPHALRGNSFLFINSLSLSLLRIRLAFPSTPLCARCDTVAPDFCFHLIILNNLTLFSKIPHVKPLPSKPFKYLF